MKYKTQQKTNSISIIVQIIAIGGTPFSLLVVKNHFPAKKCTRLLDFAYTISKLFGG